jgi:hypothetical protein
LFPNLSDPGHTDAHPDQGKVILRGTVVGEPDVRDSYTNLRLAVDCLRIEDSDSHQLANDSLQGAPATGCAIDNTPNAEHPGETHLFL